MGRNGHKADDSECECGGKTVITTSKTILLPAAFAAFAAAGHIPPRAFRPRDTTTTVGTAILDTPSVVDWTYISTEKTPPDGPKVHPVNGTTGDWWYFDAISTDLASGDYSSLVIAFYEFSSAAFFANSNTTTILDAGITGTFPNGTIFGWDAYPAKATITTMGDSSSGAWGEYSAWSGSEDLKTWTVTSDDAEYGVNGSLTITAVAPPHLPCGPVEAGATFAIFPHFGWINPVPDADAEVSSNINGSGLAFNGIGYHEKNFIDQPLLDNLGSYSFGHGRLGPYSIVWFDARTVDTASAPNGTEWFSSYVSKGGEVLSSSCKPGSSVLARPWGGEDAYPPPKTDANPDDFIVTFADVGGKEMKINVTTVATPIPDADLFDRWLGTMEGGFTDGSGSWTGVAQYEEFKV